MIARPVRLEAALPIRSGWLQPLSEAWPSAVIRQLSKHTCVVRTMVVAIRGSAPRDAGACMLVTSHEYIGTIGGGHLEWQAIQSAQQLLVDLTGPSVGIQRLILGKQLAQCCGGEVTLWLERFTRADLPVLRQLARTGSAWLTTQVIASGVTRTVRPATIRSAATPTMRLVKHEQDSTLIERIAPPRTPLWLYGAGHVGQALIRVLTDLPLDITWIDTRAELLPENLPDHIHAIVTATPLQLLHSAPATAHHRVLTHDHSLDYALCHAILARGEFASLGMIGSQSKAAKFRAQLRRDAITAERIEKLICPIGIKVPNKEPAAIAISIAAQLLQQLAAMQPAAEAFTDAACREGDCSTCPSRQAT